jgi:hypothetical protein
MAEHWHVTSQRQEESLNEAHTGFQTEMVIAYHVDKGPAEGTTGEIRVPLARYNAAHVAEIIHERVSAHNEVHGL